MIQKDYSEQLEFLNSEPYYASKKTVNQSWDFPVRRTGSSRHKKALHMYMHTSHVQSPITKEIVNHVVFSYSFVRFCADFVGILNLHLFTVFLFYFSVHIHLLCVNKYFYLLIETDT